MKIDPKYQSRKDAYLFSISLITPRPIAFVTSQNEKGLINAAPFSYFNGICTNPALFTISISNKKENKKDTAKNILTQKEFCLNFITKKMAEGVTISAADFPSDISEMDYNGFTLVNSEKIKVPRIKESPASIECRLVRAIQDLGPFTLIIGEVLLYHINDSLIDPKTGFIDPKKANFLGRLGGSDFCEIGDIITIPRKPWEEYSKISSKKISNT